MKNGPTDKEKREWFTDSLQRLFAIEFPTIDDNPQTIFLLFHDEEYVKRAVFFLQDYEGTGFSLIIERVDHERVTLKIYEPDTDDFHVCNGVPVRTNIFEKYRDSYKPETFLSVGQLELIGTDTRISPVTFLKIPLKSVSFRETPE